MTRLFKLNEINSNWIFLFPVLSGILKGYMVYSLLALCILVASSSFHIFKHKNSIAKQVKYLRFLDIFVATACYCYMFYFVNIFLTQGHFYFYTLLLVTILIFIFGKTKSGMSRDTHSYFHIAIGVVAGLIPLFV